jgi:hypothetical protein
MNIKVVGFSLLSAGIFRGRLALADILFIAIETIRDWCQKMYHQHIDQGTGLLQIKEIHLCGFTQQECHVLNEVCLILLESSKRTERTSEEVSVESDKRKI